MEIMAEVDDLVKRRRKTHGLHTTNHRNIAATWNAYLGSRPYPGEPLDSTDVALMLALLKIARTHAGEYNRDDYVDLCGYGALATELSAERNPFDGGRDCVATPAYVASTEYDGTKWYFGEPYSGDVCAAGRGSQSVGLAQAGSAYAFPGFGSQLLGAHKGPAHGTYDPWAS